jgi:uncharacterized protein YjbI with pentapeptide repeats
LSGAILAELSIEGTKLEGSDLYHTWLAGTEIKESYMKHVILTKAILNYATIYRCNCQHSKFIRPELAGATIKQSDFQHADFTNTRFVACCFDNVNCNNANFTGARFFGQFDNVTIIDATFTSAFFDVEHMTFTDIKGIDSIIADQVTVLEDGEQRLIEGEQNVKEWFKSVVNNG